MIKVGTKEVGIGVIFAAEIEGGIGFNGKMPWHIPEDLKEFKKATLGQPVIMGRKTWGSLCGYLPGRLNVVISSNPDEDTEHVVWASGLREAVKLASANANFVWVIGGKSLIEEAIDKADIVQITEIRESYETDVKISEFVFDIAMDDCIDQRLLLEDEGFDITRYFMTGLGLEHDRQ